MPLLRMEVFPYRLRLAAPWPGPGGPPSWRRGWWLRLAVSDGEGWGECAPLPAAGTETEALAARRLADLADWGGTETEAWTLATAWRDETPAVACALETALLDLSARRQGLPLRRLLEPEAADRVAVSAMAGSLARPWGLASALEAGFRVIKLKTGGLDADDAARKARALALTLPGKRALRLDANRAWSFDAARRFLTMMEGEGLESVEEPLRQPDATRLARLQAQSPVPLALDESFQPLGGALLLNRFPVRRLMLKPMALGGLRPTLALARKARTAGVEPVITSTLESAVGLHAAAHLAAALAACNPDIRHGLATASWLRDDPHPPPSLEKGYLWLSDDPGLGLTP